MLQTRLLEEWAYKAGFDADRETVLTVYVQWIYLHAIGRVDAAKALLQWGQDKFLLAGIVVGPLVKIVHGRVKPIKLLHRIVLKNAPLMR